MKKLYSKIDVPLLIMTILYCMIGLLMIYSSSSVSAIIRYNVPNYYFFLKQAIIIVTVLLFCFTLVLKIPTRNYNYFIWPLLALVIVGLIFLLVKGKITNHAASWYKLGHLGIQPSEFAKSIMIIFMACFYDNLSKKKTKNIYLYLIPLLIGIAICVLIMMQPDLGSAVILAGILFLTFISVPMVKNNLFKIIKVIGIALIIFSVIFLYSGDNILNSAQLSRLKFRNPCSRYTEESGYQVCNGFIAMNNGGLFGVGLGKSTQKYLYLPESHTDFIFPIIVEELGLVTGILIVIGYVYILYRILKIARNSETLRCSVLAYGTFWYFALHILINLLGILAIIPLTGVPLPFLSYCGSIIINVIIMIFIVQRVNIENKINKTNREIRAL